MFSLQTTTAMTAYTRLTAVNDGEQLMELLGNNDKLPEVLFLDLNMPRKNGFECLAEIKATPTLQNLPVVIFSTSFDNEIVTKLYNEGANFYIRKPSEFRKFAEIIHRAISAVNQAQLLKSTRENFILYS